MINVLLKYLAFFKFNLGLSGLALSQDLGELIYFTIVTSIILRDQDYK